jgi:aminoglycoside/choline kinase family phosphotransferase
MCSQIGTNPVIPTETDILAATATALPKLKLTGAHTEPITNGGSDRSYHRVHLARGTGVVFMQYSDKRPDNLAFATASKTLKGIGVSIPKLLHHDAEARQIWLQDLGAAHLMDQSEASWKKRQELYRATIDEVAKIHAVGEADLKKAQLEELEPAFDEAVYGWEQDYFFEHFLNRYSRRAPSYVRSLRDQEEFAKIVSELTALPRSLVHRDLQSQNVLLHKGAPFLIDFQGLRLGRPEYDIASLLYDPYVEFTDTERTSLAKYAFRGRKRTEWEPIFLRCAAQRMMQALGAFSKLGNSQGRSDYLRYIPIALDHLRQILEDDPEILPRLGPYLSPEAMAV